MSDLLILGSPQNGDPWLGAEPFLKIRCPSALVPPLYISLDPESHLVLRTTLQQGCSSLVRGVGDKSRAPRGLTTRIQRAWWSRVWGLWAGQACNKIM